MLSVFSTAQANPEVFLVLLTKPREPSPDLPLLLAQLLLQGRGRTHLALDILHCHLQSPGINKAVNENVVALLFPAYAILLLKGSQKHQDRSPPDSFVKQIPQCGQCTKRVCLQNEKSAPIASNNTAKFFEHYFPGLQPSALKCYVRKT